jgi:hypothetical protein
MSCMQDTLTKKELLLELEHLGTTYTGLVKVEEDDENEDDYEGKDDQDLQSSKSTYSNKVGETDTLQ